MTISEALLWAKSILRNSNTDGPEASANFLLRQVLSKDKIFILTHPEQYLTAKQEQIFEEYIFRRAKHEPVWYITGKIEFLGLDLAVNENVLIPRPETELLVEKILEYVRGGFAPKRILDVGTGSGAIVLALANTVTNQQSSINKNTTSLRESEADAPARDDSGRPGAISFAASDISSKALEVAKTNAKSIFPRHSREGGNPVIVFNQGDLFEPWKGQKFDLIVANLPYVPETDRNSLAPDLTSYEPELALFGGPDGLDIYKRFFDEVSKYLLPGGKVFCEIGYDQGEKIQKYLINIMPEATATTFGDYADIDRIVIIET
jgi:release factor glutamine methyltransferase